MPNPFNRLRMGNIFGQQQQRGLSPADFSNLFRAPPVTSQQIRPSGLEPEIRYGGRDPYGLDKSTRGTRRAGPVSGGGTTRQGQGTGYRGTRVIEPRGQRQRVDLGAGREKLKLEKRALSLRERAQRATEKGNARDAQTKERLASITEYKARNPEMRIETPKGGNIIGINPVTGEIQDFGISTGELSEQDKIMLERAVGLERITGTGMEQRRTEKVRQTGRTGLETQRQTNRLAAIKARQGNLTDPRTPREQRMRIANRAQEAVLRNPEWADKINIDGDMVTISPPTGGFFGLGEISDEEYNEMLDAIMGDEELISDDVEQDIIERPIPDGSGIATSRDGGKTWQRK